MLHLGPRGSYEKLRGLQRAQGCAGQGSRRKLGAGPPLTLPFAGHHEEAPAGSRKDELKPCLCKSPEGLDVC